MEPLGSYQRWVPHGWGLCLGGLAALVAAGLFELSRTLAERARGRWYAGNGRDVFHAGAVLVLGSALLANGLPSALAFLAAATISLAPLLLIDGLPSRRASRVGVLLTVLVLGLAPPLLEPRSIVDAGNAMARALFSR